MRKTISTILVLSAHVAMTVSCVKAPQPFLKPPRVISNPGPEYGGATRGFQGIPSMERSPNGRLWAIWYGGRGAGEDEFNYVMLATSGDDGRTWSKETLVIDPDGDGPVRAFDPELWIDPDGRLSLEAPVKLINGYVPVCTEEDREDVRLGAGEKSAVKRKDLLEQIIPGDPKTLEHLAVLALEKGNSPENCRGLEALGILKADVDELGFWMACGLPSPDLTLARLAGLSRQLHLYFSFYLPHLLKTNQHFQDIYTVFAGGDDLFVIGPWNRTIELIRNLNRTFGEYVRNKEIHFSAGMDLQKSHTPLDRLAAGAEEALSQSKAEGRNRFTLFGETVTWEEMEELVGIKESLAQWLDDQWINNAMLYRLNELSRMAGEEGRLNQEESIHIDNLSCLKWRSFLVYTTARNVGKKLKEQERKGAISQVRNSLATWLTDYRGKLRIALWMLLYEQR